MATIHIYGPIGGGYDGGITAQSIVDQLAAIARSERAITVRINSVGGDPFDGLTIAQALRRERDAGRSVETVIDGLAASAATIISSAGSPITIQDEALLFMHEPFTLALGTADDFVALADSLHKIAWSIVDAYRWTSPKTRDELRAMMRAATWMDADQAIAAGLATKKISTPQAFASTRAQASACPPEIYATLGETVPARLRARLSAVIQRPTGPLAVARPRVRGHGDEFGWAAIMRRTSRGGVIRA